jgi:hypothetical protein
VHQRATRKELMNALSRPNDSVYNTTLFLFEGWYTSRTIIAEAKRVELNFVQLRWPDAKGPNKKISRNAGLNVSFKIYSV